MTNATRWITLTFVGLLTAGLLLPAAAQPSPMQQVFVLNEIKPDLDRIGVIWTEQTPDHDEVIDNIHRATANADAELVVHYAEEVQDVAPGYRELRADHDVQVVWVFDERSAASEATAREYLIENTVQDGIPLLAPTEEWVGAGASLSIQNSAEGDVRILMNEQAAAATGVSIPDEYRSDTQHVSSR